ncbi:MAG: NADH-quinone oxidoreductase subunit I [Desulfofustis sp.]|jgi:NADH-quinone oxidoreductase subunit I|nr:NADH-quinone oxidoreductase subunit I [Desulfofustis sp.]
MGGYFSELFIGAKSLIDGMWVTLKEFPKRPVTLNYPHQSVPMYRRYRGHIELIPGDEGGTNCVVCGMCERACPSNCISITSEKPEGSKKKVLTGYRLDFTTCSLCGSCVESCNFNAIRFSNEYNLASTRKEDFIFDLMARLKEQQS